MANQSSPEMDIKLELVQKQMLFTTQNTTKPRLLQLSVRKSVTSDYCPLQTDACICRKDVTIHPCNVGEPHPQVTHQDFHSDQL